MTKRIVTTLLCAATLFADSSLVAQEKTVSFGANGMWLVPMDRLGKRFLPAPGASVHFTLKRGEPEWGGAFEYYKYKRVNPDARAVVRAVKVDTAANAPLQNFTFQLPTLDMSLEVVGLAAIADFHLWTTETFDLKVGFGAGVYHWKFNRSAYYDTLKAQTSRGPLVADILKVPALEQQDWSAGFNAGAEVAVKMFDPVWVNVGGRYRFVVGELWPTLALDMEQASTFHMIEVRAGIRIDL